VTCVTCVTCVILRSRRAKRTHGFHSSNGDESRSISAHELVDRVPLLAGACGPLIRSGVHEIRGSERHPASYRAFENVFVCDSANAGANHGAERGTFHPAPICLGCLVVRAGAVQRA
jgi:hypothetical protein